MSLKYSPESWNYLRLEFTDDYLEKRKKKILNSQQQPLNISRQPNLSKSPQSPTISRQQKLSKSAQSLPKQIPKKNLTGNKVKCVIL